MTTAEERAEALQKAIRCVERATHASTDDHEARTSALIAARLIAKHDLLRCDPDVAHPEIARKAAAYDAIGEAGSWLVGKLFDKGGR